MMCPDYLIDVAQKLLYPILESGRHLTIPKSLVCAGGEGMERDTPNTGDGGTYVLDLPRPTPGQLA